MTTKPTDAEVDAELNALERLDEAMEDDGEYMDGLTGAIKALRERMTPGQVTTLARGGMRTCEADAAMIAANWRMGLSDQRPMTVLQR
jgi:hypothetical protein